MELPETESMICRAEALLMRTNYGHDDIGGNSITTNVVNAGAKEKKKERKETEGIIVTYIQCILKRKGGLDI